MPHLFLRSAFSIPWPFCSLRSGLQNQLSSSLIWNKNTNLTRLHLHTNRSTLFCTPLWKHPHLKNATLFCNRKSNNDWQKNHFLSQWQNTNCHNAGILPQTLHFEQTDSSWKCFLSFVPKGVMSFVLYSSIDCLPPVLLFSGWKNVQRDHALTATTTGL